MCPSELTRLVSDSLYIDAHCHGCDFPYPPSLIHVLEREKILCLNAATSPESIRKAAELNGNCSRLLPAAGIHPWEASSYGPADIEELIPFYREAPQFSEIGMDAVWAPPEADPVRQKALFRAQLELACDLEKPVTLHTKGTEDEILAILGSSLPPSVLVHWFDGDNAQLKGFLDLDCFFSISPALISTPRQQEICRSIPPERLLPETDNPSTWPWLFGTPAKAEQIMDVYSAISALLGLPEKELSHRFRENLGAFLLP